MSPSTFPHELIGKKIKVTESKNKSNLGLIGIVRDETKSTLLVECNGRIKRLLKSTITLMLTETQKQIPGKNINKRPEERIK